MSGKAQSSTAVHALALSCQVAARAAVDHDPAPMADCPVLLSGI